MSKRVWARLRELATMLGVSSCNLANTLDNPVVAASYRIIHNEEIKWNHCPAPNCLTHVIHPTIATVDDGSDQDYDSHIMVWQLPCVDGGGGGGDKGKGRPFPDIVVEAAEEAGNAGDSLASSSLDLVPVSMKFGRNFLVLW